MKIGFVTCQESLLTQFFPTAAEPAFISPEPLFTPDDYISVTDLRAHGHEVMPIVWGTPPAMLKDLDIIIVRSPWDYAVNETNKKNFFAWLDAVEQAGLPIANPPPLMRWMLDKHYLQYFAKCGIQTIPTEYISAGSAINLENIFSKRGAFVLKQCISAGGNGLFYIDSTETAVKQQPVFNKLLQSADYMLQPYIPEINSQGEWSLAFFGGKYSHSILKTTAKNSILIHAEYGGLLHFPVTPPDNVIAFAKTAYEKIIPAYKLATGNTYNSKLLLYMRIDVIDTKNGPVLIECEGVEPELFFRAHSGSEAAFRNAIEAVN